VVKVDDHSANNEIAFYLACYDEIIVSIKIQVFALWLPCHLNREQPAIPHSMVMKLDVHSVCLQV